jgi:hypothetical protein
MGGGFSGAGDASQWRKSLGGIRVYLDVPQRELMFY